MPLRNHKYFTDDDDNNEVDAVRAACRAMTETNLWMFAQRTVIATVEAQEIMKERFPALWQDFDRNVMRGSITKRKSN